ncbi:MAG: ArdC-like ssDNA-binding domain-containing protein [Candidatus Sulfotelmatobacter sp.]
MVRHILCGFQCPAVMQKHRNSRITGKIIADREQGVRTWMKPWNAGGTAGRIVRPLRFMNFRELVNHQYGENPLHRNHAHIRRTPISQRPDLSRSLTNGRLMGRR